MLNSPIVEKRVQLSLGFAAGFNNAGSFVA
jgi:hypothetical protein